jgi:hypothetical protein
MLQSSWTGYHFGYEAADWYRHPFDLIVLMKARE